MALEQDIITIPGAGADEKPGVNHLFPVFLKLEELNVLLIGAGNVGLEKLTAILHNAPGTRIKVVAADISEGVKQLVSHYPQVKLLHRNFESADLDSIEVLVIATNNKATSAAIRNEAKTKNILVNVADTPDLCDFYLGSIVQKGNLKIGISTNGKSPTAAKRIKEVLNSALPAELDEVILNLHAVRNKLNGNFETKVKKLNEITKVLVEKEDVEKEKKWKKITAYSLTAFALMLIGHVVFSYLPMNDIKNTSVEWMQSLDKNFHWMVLAGFLAQLVDGALGMGYGVTSASILLSTGINPAAISGSIHTAEMFASGASGYSHYKFGNVNKKLFKILVIPGVIGAIAGAFLLVFLGKEYSDYIRPILAGYTLFLGIKILLIAFREVNKVKKFKHYGPLAGLGGFLDSFGGGGWGPIVTTTLITKGRSPRFVIGTVSLTEFFVTLSSAFSFFILLGVTHMQTILALILGGFLAAPIAAKLAGRLPRKTSFILLGILVIIWSTKILLQLL